MPDHLGLWIFVGLLLIGGGLADRMAETKRKRNRRLYAACDSMIRAFEGLALAGRLTHVRLEPLLEVTSLLEKKLWLELTELSLSVRALKLVDIAEVQTNTVFYRRPKLELYCTPQEPLRTLLTMPELECIEQALECKDIRDQLIYRGRMIKEAIGSRPAFQP